MPITLGPLRFAVLHYGGRYTFHVFEDMNFAIALSSWTVSQKKASRPGAETIEAVTRPSTTAKDRSELSKSSLLSQLSTPILGS